MSGEAPLTTKKGSAWEHYTLVKEIGRGNFSTVTLGIAKSAQRFGVEKVAVKTCPREDTQKVDVLRKEWNALSLARHPNIILAYEYFEDDKECSMVIEYAAEGTLMDWLNNHEITERQACKVVEQCLGAIDFIHENGYVHRDVKPHNILVAQLKPLTIRLADFGLAKKCINDGFWARQNSAGDFDIMSPDMMGMMEDRQPVSAEEYQKNDIYAVGVCLYFLLSGRAPFPTGVDPRKQPDFPWLDPDTTTFPNVSSTAIDVCKKLMAAAGDEIPDANLALANFEWFQMARQVSSTSNMSFTRTGSNVTALPPPNPPTVGVGSSEGLAADGRAPTNDDAPEGAEMMLVRHQTQLGEADFTFQAHHEAQSFERENSKGDRKETSQGDPTLAAE